MYRIFETAYYTPKEIANMLLRSLKWVHITAKKYSIGRKQGGRYAFTAEDILKFDKYKIHKPME